jgi:DNA-binding NtrC family response regulator
LSTPSSRSSADQQQGEKAIDRKAWLPWSAILAGQRRELKNVIEKLVVMTKGSVIGLGNCAQYLSGKDARGHQPGSGEEAGGVRKRDHPLHALLCGGQQDPRRRMLVLAEDPARKLGKWAKNRLFECIKMTRFTVQE